MTSCIYFLQAKSGGPIKIGTTTGDPRRRLTNLKTGSPEPINMIGAIEGTLAQEKQIHLLLSRYRVHGEWFEANAIVTAAIQEALRAGKAIYHPSTKPKHAHSLCLYRKRHNLSLGDLAKTIGTMPIRLSHTPTTSRSAP